MRLTLVGLVFSTSLAALLSGCGAPDLQTFEVTYKTVRDCKPAGLLGELCAARSSFEHQSRTARVTVERRGLSDFILYEDDGRSLPGYVDRGYWFASARWEDVTSNGCTRKFERTVKFQIDQDRHLPTPQSPHRPDRIVGNVQDRSSQNKACGQDTQSRREESFSGDQVEPETSGMGLPPLPGGAG